MKRGLDAFLVLILIIPVVFADITSCGTVSSSDNLTQNITSAGTCITINTSNVEINCNGYTISGEGIGRGIEALNATNATIRNCVINGFNISIMLENSSFAKLDNHSLSNSTDAGLWIDGNSHNNNVTNTISQENNESEMNAAIIVHGNNNALTNITGVTESSQGLELSGNNNTLINGIFQSVYNDGILLNGTATGNNFSDVNCSASVAIGLYVRANSTNNTFSNINCFGADRGVRLEFGSFFSVINNSTINSSSIGIRNEANNTIIRESKILSDSTGFYNEANHIIIERNNISAVIFNAVYDFGTNVTYQNNTMISTGTDAAIIQSNYSTFRGNNITSTVSTAVTTYGFNLTFDSNWINSTAGNAIYTSLGGNLTIINNRGIANSKGLELNAGINNNFVSGNNFSSNGSGSGIDVASDNNTVINNVGGSISSYGIEIRGDYNNVTNNQGNAGQVGIFIESSNSNFYNNIGYSNDSYGIVVQDSYNNLFVNSTGRVDYNASLAYAPCALGFAVGVGNNTFINSRAIAPNSVGIWLSNVFGVTQNNTFINTTIETNYTWIDADSTSINNQFYNTTFNKSVGNIKIYNFTMQGGTEITTNNVNISYNNVFLNSTNLSYLNTTGRITLENVTGTTVLVSYGDNETFIECASPICTNITLFGGALSFDVAHFTTYSSTQGGINITLSKTDDADPLNISNSTILTYQINLTVASGTAYNVTINEIYSANTTFVNATPTPTTGNNSWNAGNLTAGQSYQINITVNVSNLLTNGTILSNTVELNYANSSGANFSVSIEENTSILNSVITLSQAQTSSSGGGGGGSGSSSVICPLFCRYPENANLPVCRNNCPAVQPAIVYPDFPITQPIKPIEQEGQEIEETPESEEVSTTDYESAVPSGKIKLPQNFIYHLFFELSAVGILILIIMGHKDNKIKNEQKRKTPKKR